MKLRATTGSLSFLETLCGSSSWFCSQNASHLALLYNLAFAFVTKLMNKKTIPGLYESLVTQDLKQLLNSLQSDQVTLGSPDPADAYIHIAKHLGRLIEQALRAMPEKNRLARQAEFCNNLIAWLQVGQEHESVSPGEALGIPVEMLREVKASDRTGVFFPPTRQPLVPLSSVDLLVNARGEPSMGSAIEHEIPSADRIDLLCAFVRWNGLRVVRAALEAHRDAGRRVRVITTVYTGSTERRALDWLVSIGAEVKVSYDTNTTRLHAKAWLFERDSGFSTAYIGSSNLTHSAMLDGLEWNVRFAQAVTPDLIEKFKGTFETYWASSDYEPYTPDRDGERFDRAVRANSGTLPSAFFHFDLVPWAFQREMLQRLETERERHHRFRNLVVAATGTGKTLVAAFDYGRLRQQLGNPSLLFIAHRREILKQSLEAYRAVLRDQAFGELFVDGHRPDAGRHVFASIQSLDHLSLNSIPPEAFDVVVVDEFHHAAAPTYERLLNHLRPRILLGLTATPERTDGQSVLKWFDGRIAVELRLWDALERGLLCPFQYFGLHDGTDLRDVQWSRRGYDTATLENVYTVDRNRVDIVVQAIQDKITDPNVMRAIGFCVSVRHAEFMAREFARVGLPAVAVSADSSSQEREAALRNLRDGQLRVIFCVDLFNEGVDVPEVDTVLFLRPTESALIFLQQLGRGLRRADAKPCLTVLDFIGTANRRFRFDLRFRALLGGHRSELIQQIEQGFSRLPSGCAVHLDKVAAQILLDNVRKSIGSTFVSLLQELRSIADVRRSDGEDPSNIKLGDFLHDAALELTDVYRSDGWTWSRLRRSADISKFPEGPDEELLARAIPRFLHLDDPQRLQLYRDAVTGRLAQSELDATGSSGRALMGLHFGLWPRNRDLKSLEESLTRLKRNYAIASEVDELFALLEEQADHIPESLDQHMAWRHRIPLAVHSRASLNEILSAFGRISFNNPDRTREGVYFDMATNTDMFFITLEKAELHYSPTTMYRDYAISPDLFHLESQSTTSEQSPTGQRYIHHKERESNILLFVRHRRSEGGRTGAYTCLGAADYVSHEGSNPMAITWRLRKSIPEDFFRKAKLAAA